MNGWAQKGLSPLLGALSLVCAEVQATKSDKSPELRVMTRAALALATVSIGVFLVQRFVITFFELAFEVCIFYFSTLVFLAMYLQRKATLGTPGKNRKTSVQNETG